MIKFQLILGHSRDNGSDTVFFVIYWRTVGIIPMGGDDIYLSLINKNPNIVIPEKLELLTPGISLDKCPQCFSDKTLSVISREDHLVL